jgi:2-dehydro-3-deoxyphosphogluconate aldolase / (4S)-4-hydroxy-2-oxoglutarate aldolase
MARFKRLEVLNAMVETGLVPVFYHADPDIAKEVARAVSGGGARVLEFTNRGDFAYQVFSELVKWCEREIPGIILGVGSVIDPQTAALYINNGANFVVGPVLNPEVAGVCNRRKIPYSPGCGSVSEISRAEECGVEICKIFPGAEVGGPAFVKSVLGPMPWTLIMPTGGVETTRESIERWFRAGVACVGIGSNLISKELVAAGDFEAIARKTAEVLNWIDDARGKSVFAGIEHVGLYPDEKVTGREIVDWYAGTFGFSAGEGNSSFFLASSGPGRIEVMKKKEFDRPHIAVNVTDFELACRILEQKGVELEEPKIKDDAKAVFLKGTDPAGNRVHLLWRRK